MKKESKKLNLDELKQIVKEEVAIAKADLEGNLEDLNHHHPDGEVKMAHSQLYRTAKLAVMLHDRLDHGDDLPAWVQAKITKACDYIESVWNYVDYKTVKRNVKD